MKTLLISLIVVLTLGTIIQSVRFIHNQSNEDYRLYQKEWRALHGIYE